MSIQTIDLLIVAYTLSLKPFFIILINCKEMGYQIRIVNV